MAVTEYQVLIAFLCSIKINKIMGFLSNLFGGSSSNVDVEQLLKDGASILDVRGVGEYRMGHAKGSKNIPVDSVGSNMAAIKKMKQPVLIVCQSGMRASRAQSMLKSEGIECYNLGNWQNAVV